MVLKKTLKRMVIASLVIGTIGLVILEEYALPYWPISPWQRTANVTPSNWGLQFQVYDLEVSKGIILRGYLIQTAAKPKGIIILLHGIGSCKEMHIDYAANLVGHGFHVLVYDQRAHGKSGGKYCTFGHNEKYDLKQYVDMLSAQYSSLPIGIHGASMGGAVALQALALDKRLRFGIIESTFNTLENVVVEYGHDYFKFRSRWLARRILSKSAEIAQFNPFDIKPVEACKAIDQPILMVHGEADDKIPIAFNKENFEALASSDKEFYTIKGAGHNNVGDIGGEAYSRKILAFLDKNGL
jgi:uncharacterized protein